MIALLLFILCPIAAGVNSQNQTTNLSDEPNDLPADKYFRETKCPRAGDIPVIDVPDNPIYSIGTYVDKHYELVGSPTNSLHNLRRRAFTGSNDATAYLGLSVNIGSAHFTVEEQPLGEKLFRRGPIPNDCFEQWRASHLSTYALHGNSAYEFSDVMVLRGGRGGVRAGIGAFGGSVVATAGSPEDLSTDVMFSQHRGHFVTTRAAFDSGCLSKYMNPLLKKELEALDPQPLPKNDPRHPGYEPYINLLTKWGTHYVKSIESGGSYELSATATKQSFVNSEEFSDSFEASYLSANQDKEQFNSMTKSVKIKVNGGAMKESQALKSAFRNGSSRSIHDVIGDWQLSIGSGIAQKADYRRTFPDVIEHVYDEPTQMIFLGNLKTAETFVARKAWKNFCLPEMWNEESLTCKQTTVSTIVGKWIHISQANGDCFYYDESKENILLTDGATAPCSEFRYQKDGSIEVKGYKGFLMFNSGDTNKVIVCSSQGYNKTYARFRFLPQGSICLKEDEDIFIYAKDDVVHLGPKPVDLLFEMHHFIPNVIQKDGNKDAADEGNKKVDGNKSDEEFISVIQKYGYEDADKAANKPDKNVDKEADKEVDMDESNHEYEKLQNSETVLKSEGQTTQDNGNLATLDAPCFGVNVCMSLFVSIFAFYLG